MRLSSRIPSDWTPSPWSECIEELHQRARLGEFDLIDLTVSSPMACGIHWTGEPLQNILQKREPWMQWRPDARGSLETRQAICDYEQNRHGFIGNPQELLLTAGTSEAYSLLFRVLCNPGDQVLVPRPGYPLLDVLAGLDNLECVGYDLRDDNSRWSLVPEALGNLAPRAKVLLVVNPNNPTGSMLAYEEWLALGAYCAKRDLALVVDEVFADYPLVVGLPPPWRELSEQCVVFRLNGLSKTVGLPQAKLAWLWCHAPQGLRAELDAALEYVADAFLSVSAVAELWAIPLLQQHAGIQAQVQARIEANLARALSLLQPLGVHIVPPQGGWYLSVFTEGMDDEAFAMALATKSHVLVQPGYFFDFPEDGWLVCSLLAEPTRFELGIKHWCELWKGIRNESPSIL